MDVMGGRVELRTLEKKMFSCEETQLAKRLKEGRKLGMKRRGNSRGRRIEE